MRVESCKSYSVLLPDITDSLVMGRGGTRMAHAHVLVHMHVLAAMRAEE